MTTLIEALRNGRQIDEDGIEVAVSREAVCTAADELDRQAKEIEGLKAALTQVRKCLETANDLGNIIDTIWMPSRPETLFDFIDAAIAQQKETP